MKTKLKIIAFYLLAVLLGGCVPSVHPLFDANETIFDANLVGQWSDPNSKDLWTFTGVNDKVYNLTYIDPDGQSGNFIATLGNIAGNRYLNIFPEAPKLTQNDYYKSHLISANSFIKVKTTGDGLTAQILAPDKVKKLLEEKPAILKHEFIGDNGLLLTAPTKELQKFLQKYDSDILDSPKKMYRVKPKDANSIE
ncbi:MAG: hypothetical protein PHP01_07455 [Phycisphaerae bacterium]|nr:hypothetical protein [Phycisphaerae bacterium]